MLQVLTPEPESPEGSTPESEAESNPKRNFRPPQGENFRRIPMKRAFLLIVVPALLVALGFAQTPAASVNTDQTNIKGCLGGSDGNYTVAEDNTGHIFKITTSSVDLKPHLSHDVTLTGHRASGASSAAADDSFTVTELNMISEHCAAAAAAPAATATTPAADATPPAETDITPAAAAAAPAGTVSTPSETASTPPAAAAAPAATTSTVAENAIPPAPASTPPAETDVTHAADAADPAAAPAATVITPSETTGTHAARPRRRSETHAAATTPAVTASASSETASTPAPATPAAALRPPPQHPLPLPGAGPYGSGLRLPCW